jgi:hypothetical protein
LWHEVYQASRIAAAELQAQEIVKTKADAQLLIKQPSI